MVSTLNLVEEEIETGAQPSFFLRGFPDLAGTAVWQVGLLRIGSLGRIRSRCWVGFGLVRYESFCMVITRN